MPAMESKLPQADVWEYLKSQSMKKPIVMYGMGNGADKILRVMEKNDIKVSDFFASDGFVRGHMFHGKTVLSFSDVQKKYSDFTIVLSFASSLPPLLDRFRMLSEQYDLVAPDVPVAGETLFDRSFYHENISDINRVRLLLADDESRHFYDGILAYKLTGRIEYLFDAQSDTNEIYRLLDAEQISSYLDLGAYNGDTIRTLLQYAPLKTVYAMEPDARNFKKLAAYCASVGGIDFHLSEAGAWNCSQAVAFRRDGSRNSGIASTGASVNGVRKAAVSHVQMEPPDAFLNGCAVDLIKYDVEGAEKEALQGSVRTIRACHPRLMISAYHRSEDLFALPLQILSIDPTYRIYLRRTPYVPAWDMQLICI